MALASLAPEENSLYTWRVVYDLNRHVILLLVEKGYTIGPLAKQRVSYDKHLCRTNAMQILIGHISQIAFREL